MMKTKILSSKEIDKAAKIIRKGELVVFPTETVYGIGADAFNPKAVKKIFKTKGRPSDNPLIIHISKMKELDRISDEIPASAKKLVKKYWPGPLTIIVSKRKEVPYATTGNLETVAIRMPNNTIARKLITLTGPLAAPSANISGKPSGTTFEDVLEDFDGRVNAIIKSRKSKIGLESTVIDFTSKKPIILRPGSITYEELKKLIPEIKIYNKENSAKPKSPGMKYKHYSPKARIILFKETKMLNEEKKKLQKDKVKFVEIKLKKDEKTMRELYNNFRKADKKEAKLILIKEISEKDIGSAIMNRVRRAASVIID